ncbi:major capsid protein [Pseudodesulfovibrio sp. JC047]|uniref:major capsid protein n=1 Tax=Pseudodesulfovibrio sp. JC047 TaxID=2683199 RepID=UPI0013D099F5|nr:major capsid protein [Pseudodesulfovibrio sp. JC047]NDV20007.1 major capsid protein [Pseudodesulfovibrio sp. JC047]
MDTHVTFERRTLTGVMNKRPKKPGLFKSLFFPESSRNTLDTSTAEIHTIVGGKKLIPFVSDVEGGTIVEGTKQESQIVKTPRLRPKVPFKASDLLDFSKPGEPPLVKPGVADDRVETKVSRDLQEVKDRCEITIEYMASKSLCGGKIIVTQDNIQFEIDFRMPATHIIVLSAGSKWNDSGVNPLENLEEWADLIVEACGLSPDVCIMGTNAHKAFRNNAAVQAELDNRRIESGAYAPVVGKAYKGHVQGVDVFRYGGTYHDVDDSPVKLMEPDYILLGCTDAENSLEFGRPTDLECDGPTEYFTKSDLKKDPSQLDQITETRPLPWNKQPDAFVYVKVV